MYSFVFQSMVFVCRFGTLDQGPSALPEHIEDVSCDGTETSIANCRFNNVTDSTTTHMRDVYIVCLPGATTYSGKYMKESLEPHAVNFVLIWQGCTQVSSSEMEM